ncbi:MAG: site-specific DNA-methyltransferase, partial [Brevibacterium sp.]|nr:site-specific DNA-methyltransferase [Brevibacterium sp.]
PWGPMGKHAVVRITPAEKASSKLYSIVKALGGQNDLEDLGLGGIFSYPKPVDLVKTLVASQTFFDPEAIVLDFFAGSGTTAQAVMAANQRDEGSRKFILAQTPEPLRAKNARSLVDAASDDGFLEISRLTAERIRRAAKRHAPGLTFTEITVAEE